MEKIGKKIKDLRYQSNTSADELAEALGKNGTNRKQYIYDLEKGRIKRIDLDTLKKIADFFKVEITHFLSDQPSQVDANTQEMVMLNSNNGDARMWKEKYFKAIEENSRLKTLLIEQSGIKI